MDFLTSTYARKLLLNNGKPINERTFDSLIRAGLVKVKGEFAGKRIFDKAELTKLGQYLPKEKIPTRHSIVEYINNKIKAARGKSPSRPKKG